MTVIGFVWTSARNECKQMKIYATNKTSLLCLQNTAWTAEAEMALTARWQKRL